LTQHACTPTTHTLILHPTLPHTTDRTCIAFSILPSAFCLLSCAFCLLPSAFCLLRITTVISECVAYPTHHTCCCVLGSKVWLFATSSVPLLICWFIRSFAPSFDWSRSRSLFTRSSICLECFRSEAPWLQVPVFRGSIMWWFVGSAV
jgi:hypothetical protein